MSTPIVLVPGFWLGAWAWDEVAAALRADGHDVTALTLPGLESADADRSSITLADHVDAICEAVTAAGAPVVLAVHSGAGAPGYAVTDRIPEQIAAMVYVDTGPGEGRARPRLRRCRGAAALAGGARGGGEPRRAQRGAARDVPAAGRSPAGRRAARGGRADQRRAPRRAEHGHLHRVHVRAVQGRREGGLCVSRAASTELRDVTWIDLPTSHWPMWSRPQELAAIIGDVAGKR